jgi:hypothetical protein
MAFMGKIDTSPHMVNFENYFSPCLRMPMISIIQVAILRGAGEESQIT